MTEAGDVLAPGTRLDEIEIERVLGAGGFGVTYLARDLSLDALAGGQGVSAAGLGNASRQDGTIGPRTGGRRVRTTGGAWSAFWRKRAFWHGSTTGTWFGCIGCSRRAARPTW